MLMPKRVKRRAQHRGRMTGKVTKGNKKSIFPVFADVFAEITEDFGEWPAFFFDAMNEREPRL